MQYVALNRTTTFPLLALLLAISARCGGPPQTDAPPQAAPSAEAVASSAAREVEPGQDGVLIDVVALKALLGDPRLRIVDTRRRDEYAAGHIPGAVQVDVEVWREKSLAENGLKDAAYWSKVIGDLGIAADSMVVVYGGTVPNTARVWWTLRYLGLEDVRMLNGSWEPWGQKFYPIETQQSRITPANFEPDFREDMLAEKDHVKRGLSSTGRAVRVIDARSPGEYSGQDVQGPRGGHIPGAIHLEWNEVLDDAGRFKTPAQLRELFNQRGLKPDDAIVTHCQSGGRASVTAYALTIAGFKDVRNYYCGWQEWSADAEAPVETKTGE
jgi:thiosulfate/3-mercaptopyruvate sulfurtransferase